jgi:general stress protein 26
MKNLKHIDWKIYLKECLNSTEYCCLGSVDNKGNIWTCPTWFAYDEHLSIYILSRIESRHAQNILQNGKVSISIYSTKPMISSSNVVDVSAVQLEGKAYLLKDEELEEACKYYYTRPKTDPEFNIEYVTGETLKMHTDGAEWKFIKVIPKNTWLFDTRVFGTYRKKVPKSICL